MVIIRHSTMHTATNYYLFSLAVSDLLYLLLGGSYQSSVCIVKRSYLDFYSAYRTAGRGISLLASVSIFVWAAILQTASIRIGSVSRILCRIIICLNRVYDLTDAPMFRFLQSSPSRWSDFWPSAIHCMCAKCLASRERRKLLQPFGS